MGVRGQMSDRLSHPPRLIFGKEPNPSDLPGMIAPDVGLDFAGRREALAVGGHREWVRPRHGLVQVRS
jgi:hypothetical protein